MDLMKRLPLTLLLVTAVARADNPPAQPHLPAPAELVRRLGDESYPVREQASKELLRLGLAARDALLAGARDPDAEIRRRCRDLLPTILEADRSARLEAFIADQEGKHQHDLPGWRRFRQVAGNGPAARQLFIAMCRLDPVFLADAEEALEHTGGPGGEADREGRRAGEQCAALSAQLFQKIYGRPMRYGPSLEPTEVALLLLVAGDPRTQMPPQPRQMVVNFLYQPSIRAALLGKDHLPFKKLVVAWMERQTDDEDAAQQMFFAVQNLELREGLELALKVLKGRSLKGRGLAGALTSVGRLGGRQHLPVLEPFLDDRTVVGNFNLGREGGVTEVRDVTLAMMVQLTGQDHREYGFVFSQHDSHLKFFANFLGFHNEQERARALARWKSWQAVNR
jgi:hypothetical protein